MNRYLMEFIGAFFLVLAAILGGAVGASATLIVMVYAGGHISGAHYNPAVSLGIWMRGKLNAKDLFAYIIFQVLGAIVAALLAYYFLHVEGEGACQIPLDGVKRGIMGEMIGTFALVFVVLNVATATKTAGNSYFGLAIGGTVFAMATILGSFSGGAFNPAVYIGLALQNSVCFEQWWMYLVGELGGAAIAAALFSYLNPTDK